MRTKKEKKPSLTRFQLWIELLVDRMLEVLKLLLKIFKKPSGQILLRICCKLLLGFVFIWLLVIPFRLLTFLGQWSFLHTPGFISLFLVNAWKYLMDFSYLIVAIMSLYLIIEKTILTEQIFIDIKNGSKGKKKSEREENLAYLLFHPIAIFLRMTTIILTVPLLLFLIFLAFLLGVFLTLLFSGGFPLGIFFLLLGSILMTGSLLGVIYHLTFKEEIL